MMNSLPRIFEGVSESQGGFSGLLIYPWERAIRYALALIRFWYVARDKDPAALEYLTGTPRYNVLAVGLDLVQEGSLRDAILNRACEHDGRLTMEWSEVKGEEAEVPGVIGGSRTPSSAGRAGLRAPP